jgi:hypothetical protein
MAKKTVRPKTSLVSARDATLHLAKARREFFVAIGAHLPEDKLAPIRDAFIKATFVVDGINRNRFEQLAKRKVETVLHAIGELEGLCRQRRYQVIIETRHKDVIQREVNDALARLGAIMSAAIAGKGQVTLSKRSVDFDMEQTAGEGTRA